MDENVIKNLKSESRWLRLLFMVIFYFVAYLAAMAIALIAIIQAIHGFIKGSPNTRLLALSGGLNYYFYQVFQYITYNSDQKPYPFSDWPDNKDRAKETYHEEQ